MEKPYRTYVNEGKNATNAFLLLSNKKPLPGETKTFTFILIKKADTRHRIVAEDSTGKEKHKSLAAQEIEKGEIMIGHGTLRIAFRKDLSMHSIQVEILETTPPADVDTVRHCLRKHVDLSRCTIFPSEGKKKVGTRTKIRIAVAKRLS